MQKAEFLEFYFGINPALPGELLLSSFLWKKQAPKNVEFNSVFVARRINFNSK
jgi:hypothetical protein